MITSLRTTIALLNHALSLMPRTRTTVTSMTMRNAGRLKTNGMPNRRGARSMAWAASCIDGASVVTSPPASASCAAACAAVRKSVASHAGICSPNPRSSSWKYADHEMATATLPTAYSMIRSQPMIHAISSPSVA